MSCLSCYKKNIEGYCAACLQKLFDGKKIIPVLSFDTPKEENLTEYQEKTKRLSISGVQLKYSLRLEKKELQLTEKGGQYILKPIPPASLITLQDQAPENEHLTMQLASQLFKIPVAVNALIYFKDGTPAYITRRFDLKPDGTKHLQEDFAQISGKTAKKNGVHYKYDGAYEDIGMLIKEKVPASVPALESFFRLVLFNYIFSNGDAQIKNFSLIQSAFGDYTLSKAYDLMCTVIHTPNETDTALDLYNGDIHSNFYRQHGYLGRENFEEFARRLGLMHSRTKGIIDLLLSRQNEVLAMIEHSFLKNETKEKYTQYYLEKLKRFR